VFALFAAELPFNQTTESAENAKKGIATTEYTDRHGKSRSHIDMDAQDELEEFSRALTARDGQYHAFSVPESAQGPFTCCATGVCDPSLSRPDPRLTGTSVRQTFLFAVFLLS